MGATTDTERKPLWHADFLRLIMANLCVCTALYMFFPVVPVCLGLTRTDGVGVAGLSALVFAAGACLPAPFCNYWLDVFRRKSVALWSLVGLVCTTGLFLCELPEAARWVARAAQGAAYMVFQIAVGSTLLLDLADTRKRTEAAHVYYWFSRLALVFGLLMGLRLPVGYGTHLWGIVAVGLLMCAGLLLLFVRVPFRAPLEPSLCTFDRFWLPRGLRLFVPHFAVCMGAGLLCAHAGGAAFFVSLALGFCLSLWVHSRFFGDWLEGEFAWGFACLLLSVACMAFVGQPWAASVVSALLLGCGLGAVTSRYLLSYIRICAHCERGTAQTSYLLGWDMGLLAGSSFAFGMAAVDGPYTYLIIGGMFAASACFHFALVGGWYRRRKRK